jgi:hypothetical protein
MSTALVVQQQSLTPDIWNMIQEVAPTMKDSRLFGVATVAQASVIMCKGFELGLSLTASFEFIAVIQDKPTLIPRGALALIYQSGELETIRIEDKTDACTVYMKRRGGIEYTTTFTMEMAQKAGLVKPGGAWESYGPNMLRWRAIGFCADVVFPDVLGGLKRADEFGADVDASGDVIETEWRPSPAVVKNEEQPTPAQITTEPAINLNDLVQQYGAEAVLVAGEGKLPGTTEELTAVAAKLNGGNSNE